MSSSIPPSTPGKPWQPPAPEDLALELPQYEILGLLGRGGMGAVYHARQKSLDREVAIKVLPPSIEDGDMHYAERFKAEAQSMARLNHPGIVAVYDAGETAGGLLYFVMEMVQGTDVARMIAASGRLPPEHAYAIVAHVCDALAYAHGNGIIHRDIKPANIMVDMQGRVKVADFGLAKAVNENSGFTQSNMAVGTPDFVAPEALIPGMALDARADLYAVGVMLHQMLTGQIPRGAWQPASVVVPGIDARFDQIILKAMQYDREQRHSSAVELRQHLDTLLMPAVPAPDLQRYSSAGMAKTPQESRPGVATARPAAASALPGAGRAVATPGLQPEAVPAKSKTPLFIGLGAAAVIAAGAVVMLLSGSRQASVERLPASASSPAPVGTLASSATGGSAPIKVVEPAKAADASGRAAAPAAAASVPAATNTGKAPASPSAALAGANAPPATSMPAPKQDDPKLAMAAAASGGAVGPPAAASVPAVTNPGKGTASPSAALTGASALPQAAPASVKLPPELAALDTQFQALQKERVTALYEADLAKLNTSYLGGIDKAIASEKAVGHLDGVLALEGEQKLITAPVAGGSDPGKGTPGSLSRATIPDTDDEQTPDALKKLRVIWRGEHAKLLSARAAALKALVDPLDKRLASLEADLTKADRLADAKTVRGYRDALGSSGFQPESVAGVPPAASGAGRMPATPTGETPVLRPAAALALKDGFTNSLGMKFLPVKGTEVLFCIHETRRQDYAVYAAEVPGVDGAWKNQQHDGIPCGDKEDHPVVGVSWEDAQKFCVWLSQKEGKTYRLPTDEEWSTAVGLGRKEKHGKGITPEMLSQKEQTVFPWEDDFPPKTKDRAGNYADESWHEKFPTQPWMEKYSDGFPTTAPVMSFKPNKLGLYDMGGNVWEWLEDGWNAAQKDRVLRGASFSHYDRANLLASYRHPRTPGHRSNVNGFRVVMVVR